MKFLILATFFVSMSVQASASSEYLILRLKTQSQGKIVSQIDVFSCTNDPNLFSHDCLVRAEVDGKTVALPESLVVRLQRFRRNFSYDALSGSIVDRNREGGCEIPVPEEGMILETRYVSYSDSQIVEGSDVMKPVLSLATSCLPRSIFPQDAYAKERARAVLEILNTLGLLAKP